MARLGRQFPNRPPVSRSSLVDVAATNAPAGVAAGTGAAAGAAASINSTAGVATGVGSAGTASASTPGYFSDDFPGTAIDAAKWDVYNRLGDQVNSEVNAVIPANVRVGGGSSLYIDSKFETVTAGDTTTGAPNPRSVNYTSGQIAQKSSPILYGDIRVRAKIPGGGGTWPCIWMLGYQWQSTQAATANDPSANWPNGGWWEVDIAEFLGGHRTLVNNALHFITANRGGSGEKTLPFDATTRFMIYRLVWTATSMTWYVDAEDGNGWVQTLTMTGVAGTDIPDTPGYLIIHTAIGGSGGTVVSGSYPVTFEVDYVQVNPVSTITASAAQGLGSAYGASAKIAPAAGVAAGVGAAQVVSAKVSPTAGAAAGVGAAYVASVTASGATNANAGVAAGTGSGLQAVVSVAATGGVATGVGAALSPNASESPVAGVATGAGAALSSSSAVAPVAGVAAGVGAALVASVTSSGATNAPGGVAAGVGAANVASASIKPTAGAATGVGAALAAVPSIAATAGIASGVGAAYVGSVTVPGSSNAPGGVASGSGQANDAAASISTAAGVAAGVGLALVASTIRSVAPTSGAASGVGAAYGSKATIAVLAGLASGIGIAYGPTTKLPVTVWSITVELTADAASVAIIADDAQVAVAVGTAG